MPGGVSSPVRAFKSVGGEPIVFERVKGAYAWDVDGNKYIDYGVLLSLDMQMTKSLIACVKLS